MSGSLTPRQGLLLAAATVVASAVAAAWAASRSAPTSMPPAASPATWPESGVSPLMERLDALIEQLRSTPADAGDRGTSRPAGQDAASRPRVDVQLDERLRSLTAAVERLATARPAATAPDSDALSPRDRTRPVSWDALRLLAQQTDLDPDNTRRSVLFLSPRQIVDRYGLPTSMGGGDGRVWLKYEYPQDGPECVEVHFVFVDGMLMRYDAALGS